MESKGAWCPKRKPQTFPLDTLVYLERTKQFLFNGVDSTPLDTLHLPLAEARSWKVAQVITAIEEDNPQEGGAEETSSVLPSDMMRLRCQVDASWTHEERTAGLGFFLDKGDRTILMGLRNCSEITLPLQAE